MITSNCVPDLELHRALTKSALRNIAGPVKHYINTPGRDVRLFSRPRGMRKVSGGTSAQAGPASRSRADFVGALHRVGAVVICHGSKAGGRVRWLSDQIGFDVLEVIADLWQLLLLGGPRNPCGESEHFRGSRAGHQSATSAWFPALKCQSRWSGLSRRGSRPHRLRRAELTDPLVRGVRHLDRTIAHLGEAAMTEPDQQDHVDCTVIIVTYNSARDIGSLLNSLPAAAADLTLRVIVVDNGSVDDTVERVRDYPGVVCIETGANLGYAGGINVGRQHAGECEALAVLNPDLVLDPGSLREMFTTLDDPAVGLVTPMLLSFDGCRDPSLRREPTLARAIGDALFGHHFQRRPGWLSEMVWDEREYGYRHPVEWASGAAMLISASCDRSVGIWDERFFLYSEEVDYAARVRAVGLRVEYVPQARVHHRGAGSGQSHALCALTAVNRVRYFEKYGRSARALRAIVLVHELLRSADPSHRAAVRAVSRRSAWEPLISGLRTPNRVTCGNIGDHVLVEPPPARRSDNHEVLLE